MRTIRPGADQTKIETDQHQAEANRGTTIKTHGETPWKP